MHASQRTGKEESPTTVNGAGSELASHGLNVCVNCQSTCEAAQPDRKDRQRWKAEFALAGYELHELADGSFLVCRWGLSSKPLHDLEAVREFAKRVGIR